MMVFKSLTDCVFRERGTQRCGSRVYSVHSQVVVSKKVHLSLKVLLVALVSREKS